MSSGSLQRPQPRGIIRSMTVFDPRIGRLVAELDAAVDAHLGWTRRVLRCAVLHAPPGDDVLTPDAHLRCHFGRWFSQNLAEFEELDGVTTERVLAQHERMHSAVRRLCLDLLASGQGDPVDLEAFEASQSSLVADIARLKTEVLARSARQDPLTGLPLRHGFEQAFQRFCALAEAHGHLAVVLLADVDHFKRVNDRYGHGVGDQALRHVADVLRAQAHADEPVFRFGGEEFVMLLHVADAAAAGLAADRLLQALRDAPMRLAEGAPLALRASAGLAAVQPGDTVTQAVARADAALYSAKRAGRDRWHWQAV